MTENEKNNLNNEGILPPASRFSDQEKVVFAAPEPRISGYRIVRMLSEGGMGIIYLADQIEPVKRRVAIKVVKPGMDSKQVLARFKAEQQALALLDHPGIAQVYSAGTTETGRPYFVMEYVKGIALINHCEHYRLSIEERLNLFIQVCDAIQHAHQKGIIHRDIKPSNILVTIENEKPILKIIDFGIAKAISTQLTEQTLYTQQGQMIGTPDYMSPEQAEITNQDIDIRSDIYSLGVVLYELLTGVLPFDSQKLREAPLGELQKIIEQTDPPRPSTRLSSLGEQAKEVARKRKTDITSLIKRLHKELEWIPLKAMRKERTHRYRTASEFADDIRNYLTGAPLIAGPESVSYQFKKFINRNRMLVTSVVTILIVLIIGIFTSTILAIKESKARAIADSARNNAIKAQQETQQANEKLSWENYTSNLRIVRMLIKNGKLPRARTLLESCPIRLRGWEWGRLMREISPEILLISNEEFEDRPPGSLHKAIFTPCGRYILDDRPGFTIKSLFDLKTGETVLQTKPYKSGWRECTQFLPDPRKASYSSGMHKVDIVDLWSDKVVAKFDSKGENDTLRSFVVSFDSKTAAGYIIDEKSGRREIILWDTATAEELERFALHPVDISLLPQGMDWWGERLCAPLGRVLGFLPDNQHVVFADEQLSILDISSGKIEHLAPCYGWVSAYAHLSSIAAFRNPSHKVELWDIIRKTKITELDRSYPGHLILGISADGKWVGTSEDGQWDLWQGNTGKHIRTYPAPVHSIDFHPSGSLVATVELGHIKVRSTLKERNIETRPLVDEENHITTWDKGIWKYNHSFSRLALTYDQGNLAILNASNFQISKRWKAHDGWIYRIGFSPDDKLMATIAIKDDHSEIKVWETDSGKLVQTLQSQTCQAFSSVAFSPDSKHLAIGFTLWRELGVRIKTDENGVWRQKRTGQDWQLDNSGRWKQDHNGEWIDSYGMFKRNQEGELVEVPKWDNFIVQIFDVTTGQILQSSQNSNIPISMISYDETGKWLIVGRGWYGKGEEITIFETETLQKIVAKIPDFWGGSVSFTSDGKHMLFLAVTGSGHDPPYIIYSGDKIVLWDIEQRREVWRVNNVDIRMLILHPDNQRFVTLSANQKIAVHALRDGRELLNLEQEGNYHKPIAFSPDGRQLIVLRDGGYIKKLHSDNWTLPDKQSALKAALNEVQQELEFSQFYKQGQINHATEADYLNALEKLHNHLGHDHCYTLACMRNLIGFFYNLDRPQQNDYEDESRPADFGFIQTSLLKRIDEQKYQPVFNLAASLELERALKAENPEFKGNVRCRVENGKVVDVDISGAQVSNINALEKLPLKNLNLSGIQVSDISVLRQMPLKILHLSGTEVNDISTLADLPLIFLDLSNTPIRDLSILEKMSLKYLVKPDAQVDTSALLKDAKTSCSIYDPDNKPVLLMNFDEDFIYQKEGRQFVRNLCGNGNDGIMHGNILMDDKFGGLRLDGIDDSVIIPSFGNIAPTSEITIAMWIKLDEIRDQDLFSLDPFEPRPGSRITIHFPWGSDIHWQFGEPFEGISMTLPSGIIGTWEHYVFVASSSGGFMKIYRNGIEEVSTTRASNFELTSVDAHIAGSRRDNKFKGSIDDIAIYDRTLTAEEIQNLYLISLKAITGNNLSLKDPQHNVQQESVFRP